MLAPSEAAWLFLKSQPTEREQRNMNEGDESLWQMTDSHYPHNRGEQEPQEPQEVSQKRSQHAPVNIPWMPWDEGPTLAELADMSPEEGDVHVREAGRRSAAPSPKSQTTLHDY